MTYTCPECGETWTYEELDIKWYVEVYCPVCDRKEDEE